LNNQPSRVEIVELNLDNFLAKMEKPKKKKKVKVQSRIYKDALGSRIVEVDIPPTQANKEDV